MGRLVLKLFVAGRTPSTLRAIANLQRLCELELTDCDLDVIDVLERPQVAECAKILATPTLIKASPEPVRRIIGDLADVDSVLLGLDLKRKPPADRE